MENIEKKRLLEEEEKVLINSNETQISESNPSEHICRKVSEQCFDTLSSVAKARRRARNPLTPDEERALKKDYFKRLQLNFYSPKNTYLQYISLENIEKNEMLHWAAKVLIFYPNGLLKDNKILLWRLCFKAN